MKRRSYYKRHLEARRSLERLHQDALGCVLEFLVFKDIKDFGPLALVSKAFHACVNSLNLVRRVVLVIRGDAQIWRLAQAAEYYTGIGTVELEDRGFFIQNRHVQMLACFLSLKKLNLEGCRSVTDVRPLSKLTSLRELDLRHTQIDNLSLLEISGSLTGLSRLNLWGCLSITAEGFTCLSMMVSLEVLQLTGTDVDDRGLRGISSSLTLLTKLELWGCGLVTAEGFACLSSMTSLVELNLTYTKINNNGALAVSTALTRLRMLSLGGCRSINAAGFPCISTMSSLKDLDLEDTDIDDEGLRAICSSLTQLTRLNLRRCGISAQGFTCLLSMTSLEDLNVQATDIDNEGLRAIASSLTRLAKLDLGSCREGITAEGFASLSSLPSLEDLDVGDTDLDDEGLGALTRSLMSLTRLVLDSCDWITAERFSALSSLTHLQELDLSLTSIDDDGLRVVDSLPQMRILSVSHCDNVSDEAVAALSIPLVTHPDGSW